MGRTINDLIEKRLHNEKLKKPELTQEEKNYNKKLWTTFYRRNISIYIQDKLGIDLHPYQHYMLQQMHSSDHFINICSRGLAKSFIIGLYAVAYCMLYPNAEVVITAATILQGRRMVEQKIENQIVTRFSPLLKWLYDTKQIKFEYASDKEITVTFKFNGSKITVHPCTDNARGIRPNVVIYEEARMLPWNTVKQVFEKAKTPRQSDYINKEPYKNDRRWTSENTRSIYLTSAWFKTNWIWTKFKEFVAEHYTNRRFKYNFFVGDIITAHHHGLKTDGELYAAFKELSEGNAEARIEDFNEMMGESENAFFQLKTLQDNQVIRDAFKLPTNEQFNMGVDFKNREKESDEKRLLYVDFAFSPSHDKVKNDRTVIGCLSVKNKIDYLSRDVEHIETYEGGDTPEIGKRIREVFWDYEADYIVLDIAGGGMPIYEHLTLPLDHPERSGRQWDRHGFTLALDNNLHVVPQSKKDDLLKIQKDPNAIPCLIPINGTTELNSEIWIALKDAFRQGKIGLLWDEMRYENIWHEDKIYELPDEEQVSHRLPYVETSSTIFELTNLEQVWTSGRLKLTEPRSSTKDRAVGLGYGNYIAQLIENQVLKANNAGKKNYSKQRLKGLFR